MAGCICVKTHRFLHLKRLKLTIHTLHDFWISCIHLNCNWIFSVIPNTVLVGVQTSTTMIIKFRNSSTLWLKRNLPDHVCKGQPLWHDKYSVMVTHTHTHPIRELFIYWKDLQIIFYVKGRYVDIILRVGIFSMGLCMDF